MGIVSYAQNFEDVVLWRVLEDVNNGFYIDIGAQHPVVDSVSKAFYERGWRGIHVEPTTEHVQLLRSDRPDETVIQAVVAESPGVIHFYEIPGGGLSTACREIAEEHRQKLGSPVVENLVTAVTLDDVLELSPSDKIHWLKIDVEGFEREVLAGWNCSSRRPWVVVIEATYPNTPHDTFQNWEDLICAKDYELVYRDGLNRYYLHQSQTERKDRFILPPNVFDGFQLSGKATSMTADLVRQYEHALLQVTEEKEQAQYQVAQHQAEHQRFADQAEHQRKVLERLASQALAQQQAASNDHLKILAARECAHVEKLEALRDAWRQAEKDLAAQAKAEKMQALEEARQWCETQVSKLEAQLAETRAALLAAQLSAEERLQELLACERDHEEKLKVLHEAWRRAEEEYRRTVVQGEQQREALERLASQSSAQHQAAANEQLKALAARERAHAEKLESVLENWRQSEAELAARHMQAQQQVLEQVRQQYEIEIIRIEALLADTRAELGTARQEVHALQQELLEHKRAHVEKLEAVHEAWRQAEAEHAKLAEQAKREALDEVRQLYEFERIKQQALLQDTRTTLEHLTVELAVLQSSRWWRLGALFGLMPAIKPSIQKATTTVTTVSADTGFVVSTKDPKEGAAENNSSQKPKTEHNIQPETSFDRYRASAMNPIAKLYDLLLSPEPEFLTKAYQLIVGRSPDPQGYGHYRARLVNGVSRVEVLADLLASREAKAANRPGLEEIRRLVEQTGAGLKGWRKWLATPKITRHRLSLLERKVDVVVENMTLLSINRRVDEDNKIPLTDSLTRIEGFLARLSQNVPLSTHEGQMQDAISIAEVIGDSDTDSQKKEKIKNFDSISCGGRKSVEEILERIRMDLSITTPERNNVV